MMKFDIQKIKEKLAKDKEKLEENKNKKGKAKEKDIASEVILKVASAGDHRFRAVPYIHNEDYISDPFPERFYHFGIPGARTLYCPQKNENKKCVICDFIWSQMKEYKGTSEVKTWRNYLPKKRVFIPGFVRGREEEGLKFFALSTFEEKMGDHHAKLFSLLQGKTTYDFLDPVNGMDLVLTYEGYSEEQSKRFFGAKFGFKSLDLDPDRERCPISDDPEKTWAELEANFPDVDKDIPKFEKKTEEDMQAALVKWGEEEEREKKYQARNKPVNQKSDDDGNVIQRTEEDEVVKEEDLPVQVETAPVEASKDEKDAARKAKVAALLRKTSPAKKD